MTALQILEKLGADASFNPNHLSEEDKSDIEQALIETIQFNAIQIHTPPDEEEMPDEDDGKDEDEEEDQKDETS